MAFNVREILAALAQVVNATPPPWIGGDSAWDTACATADIDLVVGLAPDNCRRALGALRSIGFEPRLPVSIEDFADPLIRKEWVEQRNMLVFQLGTRATRCDRSTSSSESHLVRSPAGRRGEKDIDGMTVRVASIEHLVAMKQAAGRARDLEDIAKLRALADEDLPDGR